MKNAKKIFAVLVVLALALSMVVPAAAAEKTAKINISNATAGQTYTIYKMADLVTYDVEADTYSYKVAAGWKAFFTAQGIEVDATDFILYNNTITDSSAFAAAAVKFAKDNSVAAYDTATVGAENAPVEFDVEPGYYCIDSTLGTNSAVKLTTDQVVTLLEKNSIPGITKSVYEDSTEDYGVSNDASVGDEVEFVITVNTGVGVDSLKIVDVLSRGLKLNSDPKFKTNSKGTLKIDDKSDNGFTATITGHDDSKSIEIVYTAVVTPDAIVSTGIDNTAKLIYGENNTVTPEVKTKTFVWSFDVAKVDSNNNGLTGATFSIFATKADAEAKTNALTFTGADGVYQYNPAGTVTVLESDADGKYTIDGVDSGEYFVREIEAPTGYNKTEEVYTATVTSDNKYNTDTLSVEISSPTIVNHTGTVLPSTGATGTALFITIGGVLVVAMFVLLIVRKRMTKLVYTK
ncbi:MAG: isopeptide-forming domain-containing fimbrial protein [Clostridia bacterium]|nr:isopeptide-forming domain-containing fimbrial protein [Clostridia bacterium]